MSDKVEVDRDTLKQLTIGATGNSNKSQAQKEAINDAHEVL